MFILCFKYRVYEVFDLIKISLLFVKTLWFDRHIAVKETSEVHIITMQCITSAV